MKSKMSYDVELTYPDSVAQVDNHREGGIYIIDGTTDAHLNITYNYSRFFYTTIDSDSGIRWLYGKTGAETLEKLREAVTALGTQRAESYWDATPGNAGYALSVLARWAEQHPSAIWTGD